MTIRSRPQSKEYDDNFDRIFRPKKEPVERPEICKTPNDKKEDDTDAIHSNE